MLDNKIFKKLESFGICCFKFNDNKEIEILLVQPKEDNLNKWGFPKGKINKNEKELDAAIRKFKEEAGNTELLYLFRKSFFQINKYKKIKIFLAEYNYFSELNKNNINNNKIIKHDKENNIVKFFNINNLPDIFYGQQHIMNELIEFFKTEFILKKNI